MRHLALCIFGPDRPGIVEQISRLVFDFQGHWQGASLAHLAGRFAGIIEVQLPDEQRPAFEAALHELTELDIRIAEGQQMPGAACEGYSLALSLVANDRPGIVQELTHNLGHFDVNIEEMSTQREPAHNYGELFRATARLKVPLKVTEDDIRTRLEQVADDWMLELDRLN